MGCDAEFSRPISGTNLCQVTSGVYAGETTDEAGVLTTGDDRGVQIGTCDNNGIGGTYVRIPHASASPSDVNDLLSRVQSAPISGFARYDVRATARRVLCVSAPAHASTYTFLEDLRDNPGGLNRGVRARVRDTVGRQYSISAHETPPETGYEFVASRAPAAALYGAEGVFGVSITFGVIVPWLTHHFGPQATLETARSAVDTGFGVVTASARRTGVTAAVLTGIYEVAENTRAVDRGERTVGQAVFDGTVDTALAGASVYAGAVAGAKIGALAGSWAPGAGNIIGAAAGLVIGAGLAYGTHWLAHHTILDT